jgi:oxygen-independent coproporphyrinogen-3 oxidase
MAGGRAFPALDGPVRHVYLHVPFCRARCAYCDFASQAVGAAGDGEAGVARLFDRFVRGIAAEWDRERAAHDVRRVHSLYLGGGTPSLLGPERLERLLELFRPSLTPGAEVTVETNPEDVSDAYSAWVAGAALRVSLGVQSFLPELRRALGRVAVADPAAAFRRLRRAGVPAVSVDLIHGIPGQTAELLRHDLDAVAALRPHHVSWYELTPPPSSPDADLRAELYRTVVRGLGRAGYAWYEVSSHALPGGRARHNVAYWRARPYVGLGPGATSTVGARRWTNRPGVATWAEALAAGAAPPRRTERLSAAARARERVMLAARTGEPVGLAEVACALDEDALRPLARAGLVSLHSGTIRVTRKGRYVAGAVSVRLFRA